MGEWSLLLFTLLMQASIGAYLWVTIIKWRQQDRSFGVTNAVIVVLSAVAVVISLLHLGTPTGALRSLLNIGSSWLSREILFSGGFFGLAAITLLLERSKMDASSLKIVRIVTTIVGLIAVFSMSMLYMSSIMPAWNSYQTMIDFYATMITLGGILTIVTAREQVEGYVAKMSVVMAIAIFVHAAVYILFLAGLGAGTEAAQSSIAILSQTFAIMAMVRWLLVLGGVGAVIASQYMKAHQNTYIYTALAMLVIGLFIGRYIFFAIAVAKGIGAA